MKRACLAVVLVLMPLRAFAAVPALCADASTQTDGTICATRKLKESEVELDRAYQALRDKLDQVGKHNLEAAEASWLKFRDLECNLETGNDPDHADQNGTIMPMLLGECAVSLTKQRTKDLLDQVKCPGGDLSCEP